MKIARISILAFSAILASSALAADPVTSLIAIQQAQLQKLDADLDKILENKDWFANSYAIANKWILRDTHGDDWLRIVGSNADYYGGVAASKFWSRHYEFENGLRFQSQSGWDVLIPPVVRHAGILATTHADSLASAVTLNPDLVFPARRGYISLLDGSNNKGNLNVGRLTADNIYGTVAGSSDERLKQDIKPVESELEKVLSLNPVNYSFKADAEAKKDVGFVAQELQKVYPEVVVQNDDGYLAVKYQLLTAPIVKAIQEQQAIIQEQNKTIEELKARIESLQAEFDNLEEAE